MKRDKYYYRLKDGLNIPYASHIVYREPWMVAVNLLLKILQPWTKSPFLVNVVSEEDENENPHFCRFCILKTSITCGYFERIVSTFTSAQYCERIYK